MSPRSTHRRPCELLCDVEHAFQGDHRIAGGFVVDGDHIHRRAGGQILQAPAEVGQIDPVHRGAHADDRREEMDLLLGVLLLQPIDQMQFRADRPLRPGRRLLRRSSMILPVEPGDVRQIVDLLRALGVDQDLDARDAARGIAGRARRGTSGARCSGPARGSPCCRGASSAVAAELSCVRVPDGHLVIGDAHRQGRVAAQVLVGEEQCTRPLRSKAHSSTAPALLDVQTMPPWRPQKAFRLAAELM